MFSLNHTVSNARAWLSPDAEIGSVAYVIRLPVSLDYLPQSTEHRLDGDIQEYEIPPDEVEALNENLSGTIDLIQECGGTAQSKREDGSNLVLSGKTGDRVLVGILCSIVISFLTCICLGIGQWKTKSSQERFWQNASFGAFFAFGVLTLLGLVWAIFAPRWIEKTFRSGYHMILLMAAVVTVAALCTVLYFGRGM